jgi:hypothetical protein
MDLHDALDQIADIRLHIARTQLFRGYRSLSTGATGVVALVAAAAQAQFAPQPRGQLGEYLTVWLLAAVVSLAIVVIELAVRCWRRDPWPLQREMSFHAIEQFVPCLVAGGLLTLVIVEFARPAAWMLPGLWAILFGLGVFASRRLLPRATFAVGGFYLFAGLMILAVGGHDHDAALTPWTMGLSFGIGQLAAAAVLYFTLERDERAARVARAAPVQDDE